MPSLTLGAHAQEGYDTCPVCLFVCVSVCYHLVVNIVCFYGLSKVLGTYGTLLGFPSFLTCGFSKKTFRSKVMAIKSQSVLHNYIAVSIALYSYHALIKFNGRNSCVCIIHLWGKMLSNQIQADRYR